MKLHHSLLAAALLAGVSTSAAAQSTGVVTLSGTIVPTSCNITLSGGGTYNIGDIDAATLNQSSIKDLGFWEQTVEIDCTGPTTFALKVADNKPGTAADVRDWTFGLGESSTGTKLGNYKLFVEPLSVMVDGVAGTMIQSANLTTWSDTMNPPWWVKASAAGGARFRAVGTAATGPVAANEVDFLLKLTPSINSRNALQLTGQETIDGSATLEIEYI